jgi:hypothetical protein
MVSAPTSNPAPTYLTGGRVERLKTIGAAVASDDKRRRKSIHATREQPAAQRKAIANLAGAIGYRKYAALVSRLLTYREMKAGFRNPHTSPTICPGRPHDLELIKQHPHSKATS